MTKYYRIAGLAVKMDSFGRTEEQAEAYLCEVQDVVDFSIVSGRQKLREIYPKLSEDECEYLSTGVYFYRKLIDHDGLMLHSSAIVMDGKAYLFTADPGTGKSTHTSLWLKQFGDRAYILNDDKPALRLEDGAWYAYGTPWSGKHDISRNERVPVAGIACLERGEHNEIVPFSGIEAISAIMKQVNRPKAAEYRVKLMKLMDKLITQVPIWKLKCNMGPETVNVSYEAMSGKKIPD